MQSCPTNEAVVLKIYNNGSVNMSISIIVLWGRFAFQVVNRSHTRVLNYNHQRHLSFTRTERITHTFLMIHRLVADVLCRHTHLYDLPSKRMKARVLSFSA